MSADFNEPQVFECPSCGASVPLPDADSFVCDYCGKTILVPAQLRLHKTGGFPGVSSTGDPANIGWYEALEQPYQAPTPSPQRTRLILAISLSIAIFVIGMVLFFMVFLPSGSESTVNQSSVITVETTPLATTVPFARLALVFGSQGDQPGQFDDARSIAVDTQGDIFVADYTSGRINKFDVQGNFLQIIQVPFSDGNKDAYIHAIAADSLDNLYASVDGKILKYNAITGELLLTIPDQWPEIRYESVQVAPDGNLYATNGMAGANEVIFLSPQGELLAHWQDLIENVDHHDPSIELAVVVNHSGMVYILSPFGHKVYGYNPDGTFNFSFGEEGDLPGQLDLSTGMIAVTEQDNLIISDVYRVMLFDRQGKYLDKTFTIDYQVAGGSANGMTIDSQGNLYYITSGGKVLKYVMNYPQ